MSRWTRPWTLVLASVVIELAAVAALLAIADAVHRAEPWMPESAERPATLSLLAIAGPGGAAASLAAFRGFLLGGVRWPFLGIVATVPCVLAGFALVYALAMFLLVL
jgi:hypothetical protein